MSKIRLGIIGGGGDSLIGVVHRIASQMFDKYEIIGGVFNANWEKNFDFAKTIGLSSDRIYKDCENLIDEELKLPEDKRMEVISILTPNFLHFPMAKKN
jgi:predicted dehydrogenase